MPVLPPRASRTFSARSDALQRDEAGVALLSRRGRIVVASRVRSGRFGPKKPDDTVNFARTHARPARALRQPSPLRSFARRAKMLSTSTSVEKAMAA